MDGQERKRAEQLKLCKNAAEMTLFRRTLFSIYFQSCYISNKLFHFWLINVSLAGSRNRLFFAVFRFFSVGKELTLLSLHGKIQSRSFKATSDETRGLFAGNFRPLSPLKFLFPFSDIIHLVHSDLLWVEYRWKRPVYYLCYPIQGLHDVFGVEMLRAYV